MCSLCGCNCLTEHRVISFDLEVDVCLECTEELGIIKEFVNETLDLAV